MHDANNLVFRIDCFFLIDYLQKIIHKKYATFCCKLFSNPSSSTLKEEIKRTYMPSKRLTIVPINFVFISVLFRLNCCIFLSLLIHRDFERIRHLKFNWQSTTFKSENAIMILCLNVHFICNFQLALN